MRKGETVLWHLLLLALLLSLSATAHDFVQCQESYPDEFLDLWTLGSSLHEEFMTAGPHLTSCGTVWGTGPTSRAPYLLEAPHLSFSQADGPPVPHPRC